MATVDISLSRFGVEFAMRKLKRICDRNGLPKEMRKREHHTKRSELNRRKKVAAEKRQLKRLFKEQSYLMSARKRIRTKIEMYDNTDHQADKGEVSN